MRDFVSVYRVDFFLNLKYWSELFKCCFFPVCFSISDYKDCVEARELALNGTGNATYANAIYHMGQCLTEESQMDEIRANLTHFYECKLNETEMGVYINATECVEASKASEIKELFDIPNKIRKTG